MVWTPSLMAPVKPVSTLYEIIEMPDGDIVLQRVDGDAEPLVRIRFSEHARAYMSDASLEVARAMVEAGVKAISDLSPDIDAVSTKSHQLH